MQEDCTLFMLQEVGIKDQTVMIVDDYLQNYELMVVVTHKWVTSILDCPWGDKFTQVLVSEKAFLIFKLSSF